jgi:hypothetical protein
MKFSIAIVVALSLLILSSGCATQHNTASVIPAGTNVVPIGSTIPAGTGVGHVATKHFVGQP